MASLQNRYFYLNAKFSPHSPPCADQLQDILQKKIETDSCELCLFAAGEQECGLHPDVPGHAGVPAAGAGDPPRVLDIRSLPPPGTHRSLLCQGVAAV